MGHGRKKHLGTDEGMRNEKIWIGQPRTGTKQPGETASLTRRETAQSASKRIKTDCDRQLEKTIETEDATKHLAPKRIAKQKR